MSEGHISPFTGFQQYIAIVSIHQYIKLVHMYVLYKEHHREIVWTAVVCKDSLLNLHSVEDAFRNGASILCWMELPLAQQSPCIYCLAKWLRPILWNTCMLNSLSFSGLNTQRYGTWVKHLDWDDMLSTFIWVEQWMVHMSGTVPSITPSTEHWLLMAYTIFWWKEMWHMTSWDIPTLWWAACAMPHPPVLVIGSS